VRPRARPPEGPSASSRSYRSIVVANVLTVFNLVLLVAGIATLTLGDWRDAMFLGILVANTAIGIAQEVRAKRALDRLAALVTPSATVLRDERARTVAIAEVVPGDLALLAAGDQVTADGALVEADALTLDEAILTGESDPVARRAGDTVRSGSFVVDGAGSYVVHAVGSASYEQAIAGEARAFRHPRSPLELVRGGVVAARRDETRCSATRRRRRRGRTRPSRSPRGAGGAPWSRAASRPSSVCPSASRSTAWSRACAEAGAGRRVLALGRTATPASGLDGRDDAPACVGLLGLAVLAERLRPDAAETVAFLRAEGVALKILSGDAPATVAAIAADLGVAGDIRAVDGRELPADTAELGRLVEDVTVIGRISPEASGAWSRPWAMRGTTSRWSATGSTTVPALKAARLAIAQGSGTDMARAVADLVLVRGDFGAVPALLAEGRQTLRNVQRVAKLFVSKSVFAALLILTLGLPRSPIRSCPVT
jgi:magnesium-transporting ATPase (P-type)